VAGFGVDAGYFSDMSEWWGVGESRGGGPAGQLGVTCWGTDSFHVRSRPVMTYVYR